eukprot:SAG22_NODE_2_length_61565_cov_858.782010_46_plen_114_part_00
MPIFYKLKEERSLAKGEALLPKQRGEAPPILYIESAVKDQEIKEEILNNILYFNDINELRINNIKKVFQSTQYNLNITNIDFLSGKQTTGSRRDKDSLRETVDIPEEETQLTI